MILTLGQCTSLTFANITHGSAKMGSINFTPYDTDPTTIWYLNLYTDTSCGNVINDIAQITVGQCNQNSDIVGCGGVTGSFIVTSGGFKGRSSLLKASKVVKDSCVDDCTNEETACESECLGADKSDCYEQCAAASLSCAQNCGSVSSRKQKFLIK